MPPGPRPVPGPEQKFNKKSPRSGSNRGGYPEDLTVRSSSGDPFRPGRVNSPDARQGMRVGPQSDPTRAHTANRRLRFEDELPAFPGARFPLSDVNHLQSTGAPGMSHLGTAIHIHLHTNSSEGMNYQKVAKLANKRRKL